MRKKRNGFTLVELLITVAIMLTILIISIVSLTNVSSRKKEKSWDQVQEEVKKAAEQYFFSNEYLLNSDPVNGQFPYVTVGALVKEDFLNKVVNPSTGKSVNKCDVVQYNRETKELEYKEARDFFGDSVPGDCEMKVNSKECEIIVEGTLMNDTLSTITSNLSSTWFKNISKITLKENNNEIIIDSNIVNNTVYKNSETCKYTALIDNEDPSVTINGYIKNSSVDIETNKDLAPYKSGDWLKGYVFLEASYSNVDDNNIKSTSCTKIGTTAWKDHHININKEGTTTVSCTLETKSGKVVTSDAFIVNLDRTGPVCQNQTITGTSKYQNGWYNTDVTISFTCYDTYSGCEKEQTTSKKFTNEQNKKETNVLTFTDTLGNYTNCKATFGIDKKNPSCNISYSGTDVKKGEGDWYIGGDSIKFSTNCSDDRSGCAVDGNNKVINYTTKSFSEKKVTTESIGTIYDKAGNSKACEKEFGLEKKVAMKFKQGTTNNTKNIKNKTVFDTSKGACKFGTCTNIKMTKENDKFSNGANTFARACENVNDYLRYFKVAGMSVNGVVSKNIEEKNVIVCTMGNKENETNKVKENNDCLNQEGTLERSQKWQKNLKKFSDYYNINDGINNLKDKVSASKDKFTYTSPAGNKVSLYLYVEYSANCGY